MTQWAENDDGVVVEDSGASQREKRSSTRAEFWYRAHFVELNHPFLVKVPEEMLAQQSLQPLHDKGEFFVIFLMWQEEEEGERDFLAILQSAVLNGSIN